MDKTKDLKNQKNCFCNTEDTLQKQKSTIIPAVRIPKLKGNRNSHFPVNREIKKTLVRNTEKQVPTTRVIKDDVKERSNKNTQTDTQRRLACTKSTRSQFDVPKPNTLLQLSKKIEFIAKEELPKKETKLAADEKVSKNLNFPYDKAIYKDLIPLVCEKTPPEKPPLVRNPLPQKDKEPAISSFVEMKSIPKYYILHTVDIENKTLPTRNNNLRLYKILEMNSQ